MSYGPAQCDKKCRSEPTPSSAFREGLGTKTLKSLIFSCEL